MGLFHTARSRGLKMGLKQRPLPSYCVEQMEGAKNISVGHDTLSQTPWRDFAPLVSFLPS